VPDINTLLTNNWTSANTDKITPLFVDGLETPWQDLDFGAKPIIYSKLNIDVVKTGMYALEFFHSIALTMEIMSAKLGKTQGGRAHFKKLVDEAVRVIKANARQTGYAFTVVRSITPRFNKDRGIYIATVEVDLLKVRTT